MSDVKQPAKWALKKACEYLGWDYTDYTGNHLAPFAPRSVEKFAAYIEQHEEKPVDPDLEEARFLAAEARQENFHIRHEATRDSIAIKIADGQWDDHMLVRAALAGIKRGLELAAGQ